ncbi:MAG: hypothetical protein V4618_07315 [Pseudomonadota bacterium]
MRRVMALLAAVFLCVGIAASFRYDKNPPAADAATNGFMEAPATAAAPLPRQPTAYGINLSTAAYWSKERAFMNLAAGGAWHTVIGSKWSVTPAHRINRFGTLLALEPGEYAALSLTRPPSSNHGDVAIRCLFKGIGTFSGVNAAEPRLSPGRFDFIWRRTTNAAFVRVDATDPADPIRDIDCREADADPKMLFDPAFVDELRPYKAVRFMDWMNANQNLGGDWSRRTPPEATIQAAPHGVALEHMVALANQAGFDPWFVLPWNADAVFLKNFATYVHAKLDPARVAYIEVGNEVWNLDFEAARQALAEGKRDKLGKDDTEARMRRYAQRSIDAFKIWEAVFADRPKRIVRVLSGQNGWPELLVPALDYKDMVAHIDAVASAPYFGQTVLAQPPADTRDLAPLFTALHSSINSTMANARRLKQMADSRGLRFIAYEGGQHLTYRGPDKTLIERLNRDPRMGEAYRAYLSLWDREFGDLMVLYYSTSPIGTTMYFGMAEYSGQPLSETPKRKALLDAIAGLKAR